MRARRRCEHFGIVFRTTRLKCIAIYRSVRIRREMAFQTFPFARARRPPFGWNEKEKNANVSCYGWTDASRRARSGRVVTTASGTNDTHTTFSLASSAVTCRANRPRPFVRRRAGFGNAEGARLRRRWPRFPITYIPGTLRAHLVYKMHLSHYDVDFKIMFCSKVRSNGFHFRAE